MIRVLALADLDSLWTHLGRLVQQPVGVDHIIDDAALADLLALELRFRRQVATIVVAEMVIGRNGQRLDSRVDQELRQD